MANQIKIDLKSVWDGSGVDAATADISGMGRAAKSAGQAANSATKPARDLAAEYTAVGEHGEEAMQATAIATNAMQGNLEGASGAVLQLLNSMKLLSAVKLGLISVLIMSLVALVKAFKGRIDAARKSLAELDAMRLDMAAKQAEHLATKYDRLANSIDKAASHQKALIELQKRGIDASTSIQEKAIRDKADKAILGASSTAEIEAIEKQREKELEALTRKAEHAKALADKEAAASEVEAARAALKAAEEQLAMREEHERLMTERAKSQSEALREGKFGKRGEAFDAALGNEKAYYEAVYKAAQGSQKASDDLIEARRRLSLAEKSLTASTEEAAIKAAEMDNRQAEAAREHAESVKALEAERAKASGSAIKEGEAEVDMERVNALEAQAHAKAEAIRAKDRDARIAELKTAIAEDSADPMSWREFSSGEYQRKKRKEAREAAKADRDQAKTIAKFQDIEKRIKDKDYVSPREKDFHDIIKKRLDKQAELKVLEAQKAAADEQVRRQAWRDVADIRQKITDVLTVRG